jgi:hypothetical protein
MGNVREDLYSFSIISLTVLLRVKTFQITFVQNLKTHILYPRTFFSEIMPFMR